MVKTEPPQSVHSSHADGDRLGGLPFGAVADDAMINGVALDRLAAGFGNQAADLVDRKDFGRFGAGVVIDQLVPHGAVKVVGPVPERGLRRAVGRGKRAGTAVMVDGAAAHHGAYAVAIAARVGKPLQDDETGPFAANDQTLPTTEYAIARLSEYGLAHLLVMGATRDLTGTPLEHLAGDTMFRHFRPLYAGTLIANVGFDLPRANALIAEGTADLVAFGTPFIANPDLPARLAAGAPLAEPDWDRVYASGARGYSDYPALAALLSAVN